jgi:hypothetical protein
VREAWETQSEATGEADGSDTGLRRVLGRWHAEALGELEYVTAREVQRMVDHALRAPGVVLGRALRRHWPSALEEGGFAHTLDVAWNGLRNYLDQRWFVSTLMRRDERSYPRSIRRAVLDGNLEAVLDEHLWITAQLYSLQGRQLANELRDSLRLRTSVFRLHPVGGAPWDTFSLRCHAAIPFTEARQAGVIGTEEGERTFRPDELRKAFNSPFWPHILTTTSIGQEGLDFHVWCKTLVHWDLASNPVDVEQREGRIQRFGGLSIRRAIAGRLGDGALASAALGESPWARLAALAEEQLGDDSGLCPWWVCEGAGVDRYVVDVPASEQTARLAWVKEQRALYRLVLGQPNQEDLLELLARKEVGDSRVVQAASIGLSAWFDRTRRDT